MGGSAGQSGWRLLGLSAPDDGIQCCTVQDDGNGSYDGHVAGVLKGAVYH